MYLKLNIQIIFLILFLFLSTTLNSQTGTNYSYQFNVSKPLEPVVVEGNSLLINYYISELNLEEVENESGLFYRVTIPEHTPTYDAGNPEVPVLSRMIIIPDGADVRIKITEVKSVRLHPSSNRIRGILYPSQESESKSLTQRRNDFKINRELYDSKNLISLDTVKIESIGKFRDNSISNIAIYPVRYNPGTNSIEVITSMKIEISNVLPVGSKSSQSVSEAGIIKSVALNFNAKDVIPGYSEKPIGIVILTDTLFKNHLAPFVKWKTQKGFDVTVIYRGKKYAGESNSEIKKTLETFYKSSTQPPDYLLIIGDTNKIPTETAKHSFGTTVVNVATDLYYGEFSGNGDYIPEMFIGRLPVSDTTQLKNVLNKIIQYEKFQFAPDADFFSHALMTAGNDGNSNWQKIMNGHVHYAVTNYLNSSNKITDYKFYYPESAKPNVADSIRKLINRGLSFINYSGHGEVEGWAGPSMKFGDTATFSNTEMYPFIISNACQTSTFTSNKSFGNAMVLAKNKGAIGFIGGSEDTYWDEDYYWAVGVGDISDKPVYLGKGLGVYDRLFHTHGESPSEWYYTMGQIVFSGNMSVSASTSKLKKYYWELYNLVGDPSMIPIIGKPDSFNIQLPDTLPKGIKSITLSGEPFSYIAVSDFDTLWDASFVSAAGSVNLSLPDNQGDSCLFVITGQNKIPLIKTVHLGTVDGEYINFAGYSINDINGNNNKLVDYGETVYLAVKVENMGNTDADNVYAKISTSSDYITITSDSTFIGNLEAETEIELTDRLEFTVSNNVADKSIATIELTLTSDNSTKKYIINILIHAPELQIIGCVIDDSVLGNGNMIADPGETLQLIYKIRNSGSSDAVGDFSVFTFDTDKITILNSEVKSVVLRFGEVTEIPITVHVSPSAEVGGYINMSSTFSCEGYIAKNQFTFRVGKVREDFETGTFDLFPWINVDKFPWTITSGNVYEGNFSAQSGAIGNSASSSLYIRAVYVAEDSIKFTYNVSSEEKFDYLVFKINDEEVLKASGETGWKPFAAKVEAGLNTFEWSYVKDPSQTYGMDCAWIDMIDFTTTGSLKYIQKDLEVARVVPPPQKNRYSMEPIIVKLMNIGRDTINGFTLAYSVNNQTPVRQTFTDKIVPSFKDTITVEFSEKYDFYKFDMYNITVYAVNNNDDYNRNDTAGYVFINELTDSLRIYPNPFTDHFTVYINSRYPDIATISMFNLSGEKVYETRVNILVGKNPVVINTPWLSPAVYIVNIKTNRSAHSLRVVKIRR